MTGRQATRGQLVYCPDKEPAAYDTSSAGTRCYATSVKDSMSYAARHLLTRRLHLQQDHATSYMERRVEGRCA